MLSKLLGILFFSFECFSLCACSSHPAKREYKLDTSFIQMNFDSTVLSIDRKCKTFETWDALFDYKEFTKIYENSAYYKGDALSFLANEKYNDRQRKICICLMQRANLKDYIEIISKCQALFDDGKLSETILAWAITPNFSNRYLVVRNYNDDSVKKVLNSIYQDKNTSSQLKETIQMILSGALWRNYKEADGV